MIGVKRCSNSIKLNEQIITWQELIRKMNDDYYLSIVFRNKQEKRQPRSCQAKTTAYWREYDGIAAILVTVTTDSSSIRHDSLPVPATSQQREANNF
jgi:hypothetical protein